MDIKMEDSVNIKVEDTVDIDMEDTMGIKLEDTVNIKIDDVMNIKVEDTKDTKIGDTSNKYVSREQTSNRDAQRSVVPIVIDDNDSDESSKDKLRSNKADEKRHGKNGKEFQYCHQINNSSSHNRYWWSWHQRSRLLLSILLYRVSI